MYACERTARPKSVPVNVRTTNDRTNKVRSGKCPSATFVWFAEGLLECGDGVLVFHCQLHHEVYLKVRGDQGREPTINVPLRGGRGIDTDECICDCTQYFMLIRRITV